MLMNNIILSLRNFSLRAAVAIVFVLTIVVGIWGVLGGGGLKITGVVGVVTMALMYVTFTVHAIDVDDKAVKVSYVMLAAYAVSLLNVLINMGDYPDIIGMILGGDSVESWAYGVVLTSAPYSLVMNLLMMGALIWGMKDVNKRFSIVWLIALIAQGISCICILILFTDNSRYDLYTIFSNISGAFGVLLVAALLIMGGRSLTPTLPKREGGYAVKPDVSPQPLESSLQSSQTSQPVTDGDVMTEKTKRLFELKELLDSGVLTQTEFDSEKKKILNGN